MKKHYLFCLILILPLFAFGMQRNLNYNAAYRHQQYANIVKPEAKDRSWRLHDIAYSDDPMIMEATTLNYHYYYNALQPFKIDSVLVTWHVNEFGYSFDEASFHYTYTTDWQRITDKQTYSYDSDYHLSGRNSAIYNNQNRISDMYSYPASYDPNLILSNHREHYYYDTNNLNSIYTWDDFGVGTSNYSKTVIEQDAQGRRSTEYVFSSEDSTNWNANRRYYYTYHTNDTSTGDQYISNLMDTFGFNIWDADMSEFFLKGMITERLEQDYYNDQWNDVARYTRVYENNRLITNTYQTHYSGIWENEWKDEINYDDNGNLLYIFTYLWNNDITNWGEVSDGTFYNWEQFTANDDEISSPVLLNLIAYPNPFSNDLNVSFLSKSNAPFKSEIYNLKGQLVKSIGINKSTFINWDGKDDDGKPVSNGVYFIKAKQNGKEICRKIVKMKQ